MGYIYMTELLILIISAYPLFKLESNIGLIIWISFFIVTLVTAGVIEKFKKSNNIQTYKEIIAFIDGKQLNYEETQQEIGKRMYQKILIAFLMGVIALIINLLIIFIMNNI